MLALKSIILKLPPIISFPKLPLFLPHYFPSPSGCRGCRNHTLCVPWPEPYHCNSLHWAKNIIRVRARTETWCVTSKSLNKAVIRPCELQSYQSLPAWDTPAQCWGKPSPSQNVLWDQRYSTACSLLKNTPQTCWIRLSILARFPNDSVHDNDSWIKCQVLGELIS